MGCICQAARRWRVPAIVLLAVALGGCTDIECQDADGDGYGDGCEPGPDCDDDNPFVALNCEGAQSECEDHPESEGCRCSGGGTRSCYPGPATTEGVGACRAGTHFCNQGFWTQCKGLEMPAIEACNGLDDDCDGRPDEHVVSPCGGCDMSCVGGVWGAEGEPFAGESPLALSAVGELTLARSQHQMTTVWVANTGDGTVSKIDADAAVEVARYQVGEDGEAPGRVAVDYAGDVWVLSPTGPQRSMLTKIAGASERCRDTDGTGLQTSTGAQDVLPWGSDECVLTHGPVGEPGERAGSLAVDGTRTPDGFAGGSPWVGLSSGRVVQVDGELGQEVRTIDVAGMSPYASIFDPWGHLWLVDRDGVIARVDPAATGEPATQVRPQLPCFALDSIATDARGRLWLTGFACENVLLFDPIAAHFEEVLTEGVLSTRGIAALGEESWVVHTSGALSHVTRDPLTIEATYSLAMPDVTPIDSSSIAVDGLGNLWVVSRLGGEDGNGVVTRFDPRDGAPTAQVSVGLEARGQGDFTGMSLAGSFEPDGSERHIFWGCSGSTPDGGVFAPTVATDWGNLHLAYTGGEGASIEIRLRHADNLDALRAAEFDALATIPGQTPPFDLDLEPGGLVEIDLRLRSQHHIGAPRVLRVGLEWRCPGPQ